VNYRVIWRFVVGVILLWALMGSAILYFSPSIEVAGQFGDLFGAINALFSGLALAGVLVAIILQSKELELQREELKLTREEHKKHNQLVKSQLEEVFKQAEERRNREEFLADPAFIVDSRGSGPDYINFNFVNQGGPISVSDVSARPRDVIVNLTPSFYLRSGEEGQIRVGQRPKLVDSYIITLVYVDSLKRKRTVELKFLRQLLLEYKIRDYVDPSSGSL